jgi:carboxyl-terminal processing protease
LDKRRLQTWVLGPAVLLTLALVARSLPAAGLPASPRALREQAVEYEQRGLWTQACACYSQLLQRDHSSAELREHFQTCLRHANQLRRHRDPEFVKTIRGRPLQEALGIYEEVLLRLLDNYVERDKIHLATLVRHGLQELRFALEDEVFVQENLPQVSRGRIQAFAEYLEHRAVPDLQKIREASDQVRAVALAAIEQLGLDHSTVVMEFAWGAGNALDEYTILLTPSQFAFLQATLRGEIVSVGLKLATEDDKLIITSVVPNSPAAEKGLKPSDQLLRVDGESTDGWSEEMASARLQGKTGTTVDVEVLDAEVGPRTLRLMRQPLLQPSIDWEPMPRDGIGYIRILSFQESTPQELRDALLQLQAAQMKALVLDLRGNAGGSFDAGVQVAELFLPEGVIATSESPVRRFRNTYRSHNPHALRMPLVVLVDGETASAAEMVAGALKENQRATLVGAPTYGKGSMQCPVTLKKTPAGLWITVAQFFSPTHQPYNGRGVLPHILETVDVMGAQRTSAWRVAQQLVMMPR